MRIVKLFISLLRIKPEGSSREYLFEILTVVDDLFENGDK